MKNELSGGSETILIVEDDPGVRALASEILSADGYQVLEAADPDAALSIARRHRRVDLSLLDLAMPGMGGMRLAGSLRSIIPATKILYMSGYATTATMPTEMADTFVQKPFTREVLLQAVRRTLDSMAGSS
jgi:CheY-like chemotaxis protein